MTRRLVARVHVVGPDGDGVWLGPDSDPVPAWAAERITNPDAWAPGDTHPTGQPGGPETGPPAPPAPPTPPAPPPGGEGTATGPETTGGASGPSRPSPPPQGGPGSSTDAWRDYADALGVDVAEDAGRDDIVAAVHAAGFEV